VIIQEEPPRFSGASQNTSRYDDLFTVDLVVSFIPWKLAAPSEAGGEVFARSSDSDIFEVSFGAIEAIKHAGAAI
jgi:hypothetical protein